MMKSIRSLALVTLLSFFIMSCKKKCTDYDDAFLESKKKLITQNEIDSVILFQSTSDSSIVTFTLDRLRLGCNTFAWNDRGGDLEFDCEVTYEVLDYYIEKGPNDFIGINFSSCSYDSNCSLDNFIITTTSGPVKHNSITEQLSLREKVYENVVSSEFENSLDYSKVYYDYSAGFVKYITASGEVFERIN